MFTLLIIDDDHELFSLLSEYMQEEGVAGVHAAEPETGLLEASNGGFEAIILDVMLPGMSGFEVLRHLRSREQTQNVPVLMLTARGEEIDRVVGLEMGADDYLPKPFSPRELVARLRALLRRSPQHRLAQESANIQVMDDVRINRASASVSAGGVEHQLTVPEMRLLTHLIQNAGATVTRTSLYSSIFGRQAAPGDRSLDMLVSRLRKKLGPRSDGGERIKAVRGEGYIFLRMGDPI